MIHATKKCISKVMISCDISSNSESCISGVEEINISRRRPSQAKECNSFINPFEQVVDSYIFITYLKVHVCY